VRRNSNDLDRMDIDIVGPAAPAHPRRHAKTAAEAEAVLVLDTPYDPSLWLAADHDQAGGQTAS
jgi:hypothetical protein